MNNPLDPGLIGYSPRLSKTLLSGLTKYFELKYYDKAAYYGCGETDFMCKVDDMRAFYFHRCAYDKLFFVQLLQLPISYNTLILWGRLIPDEQGIYKNNKLVKNKIKAFVKVILQKILKCF